MSRLRVLVADDHAAMLDALVTVIDDDPRFLVVGTATTGTEALTLVGTVTPDLVLLDVNMPGGGAAAAAAIVALAVAPLVVAVSAESGAGRIRQMLDAGAVGYLVKGRLAEELPDLLARCADGEVVTVPPLAPSA